MIHFKFVGIKDMHNIYYLRLSGERSLPFGLLVYITVLCKPRREKTGKFCICENKDADQLRGNPEADQHLYFRYTDSTIPLLPKSEISNL